MHAKASVGGQVIADTDNYEIVEGNVYFPPASVNKDFLKTTDLHTSCPWKGKASYYTITAGGSELKNAAWYYPQPLEKATHIKDYVAFYGNKVKIEKS